MPLTSDSYDGESLELLNELLAMSVSDAFTWDVVTAGELEARLSPAQYRALSAAGETARLSAIEDHRLLALFYGQGCLGSSG